MILIEGNMYVIMDGRGDYCDINIDECQRDNNCSKEYNVRQDHIDGYYTCQCHQSFTEK